MHARRIDDPAPLEDIRAAAQLLGVGHRDLRRQDQRAPGRTERWLLESAGDVIATARLIERPDNRAFASFGGDVTAIPQLCDQMADSTMARLCVGVDESDAELVERLIGAGFQVEARIDSFTIAFEQAVRLFEKVTVPQGFSIVSATDADLDRMFTLDTALRQDVPGCDGWRGDRLVFGAEFEQRPPFHPDGYLVAVDDQNGEYAGLIRMWRNLERPKLGLVGVSRQYRNTLLAAALLRRALEASSTWGFASFEADVSPANPTIHRRLARLGAVQTSRRLQMVRH